MKYYLLTPSVEESRVYSFICHCSKTGTLDEHLQRKGGEGGTEREGGGGVGEEEEEGKKKKQWGRSLALVISLLPIKRSK